MRLRESTILTFRRFTGYSRIAMDRCQDVKHTLDFHFHRANRSLGAAGGGNESNVSCILAMLYAVIADLHALGPELLRR